MVAPRGEKMLQGMTIGGTTMGGMEIGGRMIEGRTIEGQVIGRLMTGGLMIEEFPPLESLQAREWGAWTDQNDLTSLKKECRLVVIYIA
jgi:hypothetical protein